MRSLFVAAFMAALAVLVARCSSGDGGDAECIDCYDNESVQPTAATPEPVEPATQIEPSSVSTCSVWLQVSPVSGDLELWTKGVPDAEFCTFGCWESVEGCNLQDVALNPHPVDGDAFCVIPSGVHTGELRTAAGGWPTLASCAFDGGVEWRESQDGGYLWWPSP